MAIQTKTQRVLINRSGKEIATERTDKQAFDELERIVDSGKGSAFARDLINKGNRYGLSEEQFWWVHKLLEPRDETEIHVSEITMHMREALRNGVKVRALKVDLTTTEGHLVRLAMAGTRSKYYGDVWVTDDGKYPNNRLYGRIQGESGMFIGHNVPEDVQQLLRAVHDDPVRYLPW